MKIRGADTEGGRGKGRRTKREVEENRSNVCAGMERKRGQTERILGKGVGAAKIKEPEGRVNKGGTGSESEGNYLTV